MAFLKTADALVKKTSLTPKDWTDIRLESDSPFSKTASVDLRKYSPAQYLLTHCTIVASVDVEDVPNAETGNRVTVAGSSTPIKRLWKDYYIKPDSVKYINGNVDAWERKLLLGTYQTFRTAENYVEHVQIPELSKGKIIDAVARDLGDTVYIDILVATDRKHTSLVADIESGKMSAMSMGCVIHYSICTKCGNVAADDTELCPCIKYKKGDTFIDDLGQKRVIAELCGHASDLESVTFIEASWVANPAFKGATLRTVLNPMASDTAEARSASLFESSPLLREFMTSVNIDKYLDPTALADLQAQVRTASLKLGFGFEDDADLDSEDGAKAEKKPDSFVDDIRKQVKDDVVQKLKKEIREELKDSLGLKTKAPQFKGDAEGPSSNDSIINTSVKSAARLRNNKAVLKLMAYYNKSQGAKIDPAFYRGLLRVGSIQGYSDVKGFLASCERHVGRPLSKVEARAAISIADILQ